MSRRGRRVRSRSSGLGLRRVVEILFRRKWFLLLPSILAPVGTLAVSLFLPKVYEAKALVGVSFPVQANSLGVLVDPYQPIERQAQIIREEITSHRFVFLVLESLSDAGFRGLERVSQQDRLQQVQDSIRVTARGTDVIEVAFRDRDPAVARDLANALTARYLEDQASRTGTPSERTVQALEREAEGLLSELYTLEEDLSRFKELNQEYLGSLETLENRIYTQETRLRAWGDELASASVELVALRRRLADVPRTIQSKRLVQPDPRYDVLLAEVQRLELERDSLLLRFTEKHPSVKAVQEQIDLHRKQMEGIQKQLQANVEESVNPSYQLIEENILQKEIQVQSLQGRVQLGRQSLTQLEQDRERAAQVESQYQEKIRHLESKKRAYQRLLEEIQARQIQRTAQVEPGRIRFELRSAASLPSLPTRPPAGWLVAGALWVGVILGVLLVFAAERFSRVFYTAEQLAAGLDIPVLGAIAVIVPEQEAR